MRINTSLTITENGELFCAKPADLIIRSTEKKEEVGATNLVYKNRMRHINNSLVPHESESEKDYQSEGSKSMLEMDISCSRLKACVVLNRTDTGNKNDSVNETWPEQDEEQKTPSLTDQFDLEEENYIYCADCEKDYFMECPRHGPLQLIPDTPVNDGKEGDMEYAKRTTPACLKVAESAIKNAGLGVWSTETIAARSCFGPYSGRLLSEPEASSYGWQKIVKTPTGSKVCYVDASDPSKSNWMRYVNSARNFREQNLIAYQYKNDIYYAVLRDIPPYSELYVFYDDEYAEELGIDLSRYFDKVQKPLPVRVFRCLVCRLDFVSPVERDKHALRCRKPLRRRSARGKVNNVPCESDPTLHKCTQCDSSFRKLGNLQQHFAAVHVRRGAHSCEECGSRFIYASWLRRHMTIHEREKSLLASNSVSKPATLAVPRSTIRKSKKRNQCQVCRKTFIRYHNLVSHMKVHNIDIGTKFSCDSCGKVFGSKLSLSQHIIVHSTERPYNCPICPSRFRTSSEAKQHMPVHSDERPFICNICNATFKRQGDQTRHMYSHKSKKLRLDVRRKKFAIGQSKDSPNRKTV